MEPMLKEKYIFRPSLINPGRKSAFSGIALTLYQFIYKMFPVSGIDAFDLAKVMTHTGVAGSSKNVLENKDLKKIIKNSSVLDSSSNTCYRTLNLALCE